MNKYTILTASVAESNKIRNEHWVTDAAMLPVGALHRGRLNAYPPDLFYTDGALDALVYGAHKGGDDWREWRRVRPRFNVLPFTAWLHLNESSLEELAERHVMGYAVMSDHRRVAPGEDGSVDWERVGIMRREAVAHVRGLAALRLIRVAPARIVITERKDPELGVVITATWSALPAASRKAPDWIVNGLDSGSMETV